MTIHFFITLKHLKIYFSHWPPFIFNVRNFGYCNICRNHLMFLQGEQVSIPVGCIPPARWQYLEGGVCIQGEGGLHPGGLQSEGGGSAFRGRGVCIQGDLHPDVVGQTPCKLWTDRCKNITLPQTSFVGGNNSTTINPNRNLFSLLVEVWNSNQQAKKKPTCNLSQSWSYKSELYKIIFTMGLLKEFNGEISKNQAKPARIGSSHGYLQHYVDFAIHQKIIVSFI